MAQSSFLGSLFEGFVAAGDPQTADCRPDVPALHDFRDQQGLEVDLIVPTGDRQLLFVEAKATRTVVPAMTKSLERLASGISRYGITKILIHREGKDRASQHGLERRGEGRPGESPGVPYRRKLTKFHSDRIVPSQCRLLQFSAYTKFTGKPVSWANRWQDSKYFPRTPGPDLSIYTQDEVHRRVYPFQ